MAINLQVGNFVQFTVHIQVNDGAQDKTFPIKFTAKRISRHAMFDAIGVTELTDVTDDAIRVFLADHITGWNADQKLVIDDATGQGAAYSTEGLELVLSLWGAMGLIFGTYIVALGVKDGEAQKAARAKN